MLSKFTHKIKIKEDLYAIFNNLLFEPVLMNKKETEELFNNNLDGFSEEEKEILSGKGILVTSKNQDDKAYNELKTAIAEYTDNKISLMYIIPCNTCNLKCKYCFIGDLCNKNTTFIEKETVLNAIKKFDNHLIETKQNKGAIIFYGAEPTICFDIIKYTAKLIKEESKTPIEMTIVTNGTLLDDKYLDLFEKYNINIGISIDGPKDVTDTNRIFKGTDKSVYDKVMSTIKKIQSKKINLGLSITLSKETLNDKSFLNWVKHLGIKDINYNLLHYTDSNVDWESYYIKASEFLFDSYKFLSEYDVIDDRLSRKIRAFGGESFRYSDCGAIGGQQLTIRPNGDITVCHGYWNSNKELCGNINEDDFEIIIKSDVYNKWKSNLTINKNECLECPAIYICGGGCAMQSEVLFGNQNELDRAFCIHTKYSLGQLLKKSIDNK